MRNRCIYFTSTGNDIDGIDSVDDRDLPDICRAERPPRVLVNVTDLHSKSVMQPLCIGVADFTCTEVRAAGARAKYVLANRRVVKRDSGNIISGAFICLSSYN